MAATFVFAEVLIVSALILVTILLATVWLIIEPDRAEESLDDGTPEEAG
jgi:hypothetical protein